MYSILLPRKYLPHFSLIAKIISCCWFVAAFPLPAGHQVGQLPVGEGRLALERTALAQRLDPDVEAVQNGARRRVSGCLKYLKSTYMIF
jgi:hypothetical protein